MCHKYQFSQGLCKQKSSDMTCIQRMSDCIVGVRRRHIFVLFLFCTLTLKVCVSAFSKKKKKKKKKEKKIEILKLNS